jgi:hypothetical protein
MSEMSICIFCGREAVVEHRSGQDAYQVECPCGKYISSQFVEHVFVEMEDIDRQAVSNFIKQCREMNEIPELHKLQETGELEKIIEKYKSAYILFHQEYTVVGGEERAFIKLKSLSPVAINQRLKFGITGKKEQYDFDQLRNVLSKMYFKKGAKLYLFVINTETEEKQDFGVDISIDWPKGLAADKITTRPGSFEITSHLKKIGIY